MLRVAERGDAADTHQPAEQQASDLLGPRDWLVKDVAANHLQADHGRLRDHENPD